MEWKGSLLWTTSFSCFLAYSSKKENLHCKNILVSRTFPVLILKNSNIKRVTTINNECFVETSFRSWLIPIPATAADPGLYWYFYTAVIPYHATMQWGTQNEFRGLLHNHFHINLYTRTYMYIEWTYALLQCSYLPIFL